MTQHRHTYTHETKALFNRKMLHSVHTCVGNAGMYCAAALPHVCVCVCVCVCDAHQWRTLVCAWVAVGDSGLMSALRKALVGVCDIVLTADRRQDGWAAAGRQRLGVGAWAACVRCHMVETCHTRVGICLVVTAHRQVDVGAARVCGNGLRHGLAGAVVSDVCALAQSLAGIGVGLAVVAAHCKGTHTRAHTRTVQLSCFVPHFPCSALVVCTKGIS